MTDELKNHVRSMTNGQRLYFLLKCLQRDISTSDPDKRIFFKDFVLEFFADWGEPMTYENCLAMLEMEEGVMATMNTSLTLDVDYFNLFAPILNVIQAGFQKVNVDVSVNQMLGKLTLSYTNKQGERATKDLTLNGNDLKNMSAYARYNVLMQYGEKSLDYRSLINMPLMDISELYPTTAANASPAINTSETENTRGGGSR